ncbi:MAG TPA: glucokinase [Stellaceae bacterium]|jgi:glucokinase
MATATETWLVGDIGGTNARFGLMTPERKLVHSEVLTDDDYRDISDAIEAFLKGRGDLPAPKQGAIAIASPITGDLVDMTNHPWRFSIAELRRRIGFDRLEVINDFTAQALALPHFGDGDKVPVGGGNPVEGRPLAVLGPGTGLGVSGLIPSGGKWLPLTGEGGHATMPPFDDREGAVLAHMRRQFDHVSAERCISGPGLVNLYNALTAIDGVRAAQYTAAQITDAQISRTDAHCHEATQMFCAMLGAVAGDLALTLGAQGGVFIAGGIVPRLAARFAASPFRARFEAKGRFHTYLAAIPTAVVTHPLAAFVGCGAALAD